MRRISGSIVIIALWVATCHGQLAVIDAANLTRNSITSIQSTITAIESVLQTGYMVLELTGQDGGSMDGEFFNDLAALEGLVGDAAGLAADFVSITRQVEALFGLTGAPDSSIGLYERLREQQILISQAYLKAIQVQTLIATVLHTINHIRNFIGRVASFLGQMQAHQNLNEATGQMVKVQATQTAVVAAFDRAEALQRMQEPLINESNRRINDQIYSTTPGIR